ncbi:hypothetical protein [Roseibium salinum]|uniref:Uncharacterized protein n=1 Tax=Roseibium salinum TaxID=1604349 RepID=A0ABT3R6C3_9HYPH|nr:hypothetical protein [Roseibium sp. DSM 29163]MCX2724714.1 hypothetical protein [Roseibium sp. DSM 29163]
MIRAPRQPQIGGETDCETAGHAPAAGSVDRRKNEKHADECQMVRPDQECGNQAERGRQVQPLHVEKRTQEQKHGGVEIGRQQLRRVSEGGQDQESDDNGPVHQRPSAGEPDQQQSAGDDGGGDRYQPQRLDRIHEAGQQTGGFQVKDLDPIEAQHGHEGGRIFRLADAVGAVPGQGQVFAVGDVVLDQVIGLPVQLGRVRNLRLQNRGGIGEHVPVGQRENLRHSGDHGNEQTQYGGADPAAERTIDVAERPVGEAETSFQAAPGMIRHWRPPDSSIAKLCHLPVRIA